MNNEEQKFSAWLRNKLSGHVVRIENCIGAGIPDISWCHPEYGECWIETKISRGGHVLLDKEQYAWGMRRWKCGGKVFVIALNGEIILIYKFPIKVENHHSSRFLRITSLPWPTACGIVKSEFHCCLLG